MNKLSSIVVWQIAQRDYKFGKGKHRSLTKATYDGIGDHFRSLWGKEAGWAHSVLFTADLRAFSEKLTSKVEVKEETIKGEEDDSVWVETSIKSEMIARTALKRELEEIPVVKVEESSNSRRVTKKRKVS